jgi:hypothetical protein
VVLADFFFLRRNSHVEQPFHREDLYWYSAGFNPWAFVSWGAGFGLYHLLQKATTIGSSIPSLAAAGLIYLFLMALWKPAAEMRPLPARRDKAFIAPASLRVVIMLQGQRKPGFRGVITSPQERAPYGPPYEAPQNRGFNRHRADQEDGWANPAYKGG